MKLSLISRANNPTGMTVAEVERDIAQCSGFVKMMTGVANNCAYGIMMDALDNLRKHPRYSDKRIKRLFEGNQNSVLSFYKRYRNRLRWPWPNDVAFFGVKNMSEETRKKYGEPLTDAQYFEFWESTGALAYEKSRNLVTSLQNKFRLSLLAHDVPHPEIIAWGLVGSSVLEMAVETWERSMRSVHEAVPVLQPKIIEKIYAPFNMLPIANQWHKAVFTLCPESNNYTLDTIEKQNITNGLVQLRELWISPDLPFDATIAAVEDFNTEVFRSARQVKKTVIDFKKMRNNAIQDIEEQKRQARLSHSSSP